MNSATCVCQGTYTWQSSSLACACAFYAGKAQYINGTVCTVCALISNTTTQGYCSACSGGPFASSMYGCMNCTSIPYGVGVMNVSWGITCQCQTGYYFIYALGACVCDISQQYAVSATGCSACSTITNLTISQQCKGCAGLYYYNSIYCQLSANAPNYNKTSGTCNTGYTKQTNMFTQVNECICSLASGYFLNGSSCSLCTKISTTTGLTVAGCQNCSQTEGYFQAGVACTYCPGIAFTTGVVTINGCGCISNYFWNVITSSCQCDWVIGYFSNGGSCLNCSNIANTILPANATSCGCIPGYLWNASTLLCDCNTNGGSFISTISGCINCQIKRGSNGQTNGSSCICIAGFVWDPVQLICTCDYNQNFYQINGVCWDCSLLPNANSFASASGCLCANGFTWISSINACSCPPGYITIGTTCLSCSQAVSSLPSGVTVNGCTTCSFSQGFTMINGICFACSTLQLTTSVANSSGCGCTNSSLFWVQTLGSCACNFQNGGYYSTLLNNQLTCTQCTGTCSCGGTANSVYVNGICMPCAGIPFSSGIQKSGICQCYTGYKWSQITYPFQCICSFAQGAYINGTTCMNCSSLPITGNPNSGSCSFCDPS